MNPLNLCMAVGYVFTAQSLRCSPRLKPCPIVFFWLH